MGTSGCEEQMKENSQVSSVPPIDPRQGSVKAPKWEPPIGTDKKAPSGSETMWVGAHCAVCVSKAEGEI